MPKEDIEILQKCAGSVKGVIVEIGCWVGRSSKTLCLASPESVVYSIDPLETVRGEFYCEEMSIDKYLLLKELENNMEGIKNWRFIQKRSEDAILDWKEKIDLLFIDGNHDYKFVVKDLRWLKFLKVGGYVLFHDYFDSAFGGIKKAVDRRLSDKYLKYPKNDSGILVCRREE